MVKISVILTILVSLTLPAWAGPQQQESLGEAARHLREQKEAGHSKATKVFTNDNLPAPVFGEAINSLAPTEVVPPVSEQSSSTPATHPSSKEPGSKKPEDKMGTRDYWQGRFKAARRDIAKAKEHLTLAEDELNLIQIQQVREMDPGAKADLTAKMQAKQSEVDINKTTMNAAQKVLDDLENEFRDSGAPVEWSKAEEGAAIE